jgi:hypothetical protein
MAVRLVISDCTVGSSKQIEDPTWKSAEAEILQMDGQQHSSVGMMVDDDHHMLIGGGGGRYVVSVRDGDRLCTLKNPQASGGKDVWIVAGEGADYPEDEVVDLPDTLKVARWYFQYNSLEPSSHCKKS